MLRDEWKFHYSGTQLVEAARAKLAHHTKKHAFWLARKEELLGKIRSEGLEVTESEAVHHTGHKARDWRHSAKVMVRNDLQAQLDECLSKLVFHTEQLDSFQGWLQVFEANPGSDLPLDHEDWLFFFGRDQ